MPRISLSIQKYLICHRNFVAIEAYLLREFEILNGPGRREVVLMIHEQYESLMLLIQQVNMENDIEHVGLVCYTK